MYSTNKEYRQTLRKFFKMNVESIEHELNKQMSDGDCEYDDESYDEALYDSEAVDRSMTYIIQKTANNHLFDELYELAAAKLFSTDKPSGLCILLSYDFFQEFYTLWMLYDMNESALTSSSAAFVTLKTKLLQR